jgi:hypothetical protein
MLPCDLNLLGIVTSCAFDELSVGVSCPLRGDVGKGCIWRDDGDGREEAFIWWSTSLGVEVFEGCHVRTDSSWRGRPDLRFRFDPMRVFEIQRRPGCDERLLKTWRGLYMSISLQVRLKRAEIVAYRGVQPKAEDQ